MFHPDLRLLRCFAAIADTGSVTRAAERLHLSQPTLSGQIRELEQAIGFALFHRTSRSVTLTPQGERLLPHVRAVLVQTERVRREVEDIRVEETRHFRLGAAMYTMDIAERSALLDDFAEAAPDYRLTIDSRLQSDQIPDLVDAQLDAAMLLGIATPAWTHRPATTQPGVIVNEITYPETLQRVVLRRQRIGLRVPRESALAAHSEIPRTALAGQQIAMLSVEHGQAIVEPIEHFLRDAGARLVRHSEGNAWAIERHAERQGIGAVGIGWYPTPPGLVHREVEGMEFHLEFAAVLGAGTNPAARFFFNFAREWQAARTAAQSER
ncbi:MAG: LysR family transcriptional regulator [Pseudomonadota bacterium]